MDNIARLSTDPPLKLEKDGKIWKVVEVSSWNLSRIGYLLGDGTPESVEEAYKIIFRGDASAAREVFTTRNLVEILRLLSERERRPLPKSSGPHRTGKRSRGLRRK